MFPPLIQELLEFDQARQVGPISIRPHAHHFFQMDVVLGGCLEISTRRRKIRLKPGDGTLIPPLAVHGFGIADTAHHATFKFRVHPRYYARFGYDPRVFRFEREQLTVAKSIRPWRESDDPLSFHGAFGAATLCLVHALRSCPTIAATKGSERSSYPSPEMWAAVNDVIARPKLDWTVEKLAERSHLSMGHFSKTFIRWFGQTPREFLLQARIGFATQLLDSADASIKSVARASGYATVHSFSRAFRRATGATPAAYGRTKSKL